MLRILSMMPVGFALLSLSGVGTSLGAGGFVLPVVFAHLGGFGHGCFTDGAVFSVGHFIPSMTGNPWFHIYHGHGRCKLIGIGEVGLYR